MTTLYLNSLGGYSTAPQVFGAKADGVTDDTAAIQDAIDVVTNEGGGQIYFPFGTYLVSSPITVNSNITLTLLGKLKGSNVASNILNVTGNNVKIIGAGGGIEGPGTYVQDWSSSGSLIYCSGNYLSIDGLNLWEPPSVGIWLFRCLGAQITNCKIIGGPHVQTGNQHYGILYSTGSDHVIANNEFLPNALSGACCQSIAGDINPGYPARINISDNIMDSPLEKGIYGIGDDSIISGNIIRNGVEGLRWVGIRSIITNNEIYNTTTGGVSFCNITDSVISNNIIQNCQGPAIDIYHQFGSVVPFDRIIINNNIINGHATLSQEGIKFDDNTYGASDVSIVNNIIRKIGTSAAATTYHAIRLMNAGAKTRFTISGNTIDTVGDSGIHCLYLTDSTISDNIVYNVSQKGAGDYGIVLIQNCANVLIKGNKCRNTDANMARGVYVINAATNTYCTLLDNETWGATAEAVSYLASEGHNGKGNRRIDGILSGTAALGAGATTTIANTEIMGTWSRVLLWPTNAAAGTLVGSAKCPYVTNCVAGTSFDIVTASGAAAAGTETFFYEIVQ